MVWYIKIVISVLACDGAWVYLLHSMRVFLYPIGCVGKEFKGDIPLLLVEIAMWSGAVNKAVSNERMCRE